MTVLLFSLPAAARHIAGGELFYEYLSSGTGNKTYRITLRLFRDCFSTGPLLQNEQVTVGIYASDQLVNTLPLSLQSGISTLSLNTSAYPCLVGNVNVCYEMAVYSSVVTLPDNTVGYTLSRIGCCRVDRISGLSQPNSVGSNYVTKIPGTSTLPTGFNSSPQFLVKDTSLVCSGRRFTLDFGAIDPDNDSLTFALCDAYTSPGGNNNNNLPPASVLNLIPIPYSAPFSGAFPLGPDVNIDPHTGIISGIAPAEGQYVVNVCITEWRNGKPFTEHRKDFILQVRNCDMIEAVLPDKIVQCNDFSVHFENQSLSSAIQSYLWDFGDPGSPATSGLATVNHIYSDTGRFMARLYVTGPKGCEGQDSTIVLVYPGFKVDFNIAGSCIINPYRFLDATTTRYGVVDSWSWNFGDADTQADTSHLRNAVYTYKRSQTASVRLLATSSKGCVDSLHKDLVVRDKPFVGLPFKDTLICSIDTLQIIASGNGVYSWLPNKDILFPNTSSPLVFPKDTTKYIVTVNDAGCIGTDTVTVNVLDFITVQLAPDTTICRTDTFRLNPVSHALRYNWTPAASLSSATAKSPLAFPLTGTTYSVTANLGKCQATAQINVRVVPYPVSSVITKDTTICFGDRISLRANYVGTSFAWSPASALSNSNTLTPIAGPVRTTDYIFMVTDNLSGCPKPVYDTVTVTVIPPVQVDAGRDTAVVPQQPLQLRAISATGRSFLWTPSYGLNNASIANPVAVLTSESDLIKYKVRATDLNGCYGEDELTVTVYKTLPEIFIPSAFTPNGDGRNDLLRPLTAGISQLIYFRIYNRWGQLVFSTSELGKGWDGTFDGVKQPSGTYVYMAEALDYTGRNLSRKGTCVLIR
ncbi:PKD domain-containing protein [Sediminibacterium ginsengisoli]|nr:PKD domain-containing protein [Sediminibacterium ginsengisoli]